MRGEEMAFRPVCQGTEYERMLFDRASRWPDFQSPDEWAAEALQDLAAHEGIDFATALLYDRVTRSPVHGRFLERLDAVRDAAPVSGPPATVAIVPRGVLPRVSAYGGWQTRPRRSGAAWLCHGPGAAGELRSAEDECTSAL
jgi:hypothetical protein